MPDDQESGVPTIGQWPLGTWMASVALLIQRGLKIGAYIDLGCADGHFGLGLWKTGIVSSGSIVNIDANPLYEPSLKRIQRAVGGHYRICAVSDTSGTIEMHMSAHPYWASAAVQSDGYWDTINNQLGQTATVPCRTVDSLVAELAPTAPYLIKLDIQGLEVRALRGAALTLASTAVVVCEAMVHQFREINAAMEAAGFELFDLADLSRAADQRLAWFYPTYLHRNYAHLNPMQVWSDDQNEEAVEMQGERRASILSTIDRLLGSGTEPR